jgi:hypothetical protein
MRRALANLDVPMLNLGKILSSTRTLRSSRKY